MYLAFVHYVGKDYSNNYIYEFLFTDNLEEICGENWDSNPANGNPLPPIDDIVDVGRFYSQIYFEVIQENSVFCMNDAKDGLIALAWEDFNMSTYEDGEPEKKMFFKFGESKQDVDAKFYARDLVLKYKEKTF